MKSGYLSGCFKGIAGKQLSKVEANLLCSNQHEFNGDRGLRQLLGTGNGLRRFQTTFLYMSDMDVIHREGEMTWYDAREKNPSRTEWRLYFPTTDVMLKANEKDTLIICRKTDETLLVIVARCGDTVECQLKWLFGILEEKQREFTVKDTFVSYGDGLDFVAGIILEQIGIELDDAVGNHYLEEMISKFNGVFPSAREFSEYARNTLDDVDPVSEPDDSLLRWMEREEILFRTLERHMVKERLKQGFVSENKVDVDDFIRFSLSVQNRRKSRAGHAFENHVERLLMVHQIHYSRNPVVENKKHPDFLFPDIRAYNDKNFPEAYLSMLGVKSTCKDRWRQIMSEADRIERKHLLTLEAAISVNQTEEMKAGKIQLILPAKIHSTYTEEQRKWLYSVEHFLKEVKDRQKACNWL